MQKVNILGTDYTIETHKLSEDEVPKIMEAFKRADCL